MNTKRRKFIAEGLLLGFTIGGVCGFLEMGLVIFTGFNVSLPLVLYIYAFDLAAGAAAGVFVALVSGTAVTAVSGKAVKVNAEALLPAVVIFSLFFLQGLVFLSANYWIRTLSGLGIVAGWLTINATAASLLYVHLKKWMEKNVGRPFLPVTLAVMLLENVMIFGVHVIGNLPGGFFSNASLIVNTILVTAAVVLFFLFTALMERGRIGADLTITDSWKALVSFFIAGLAAAVLILAFVQPRFPVNESVPSPRPHRDASGGDGSVGPNVVMISIDTLRADRLGAYGSEDLLSPNMDALAGRGTVFGNAVSQSPWTLPSHASLLTSLYPSRHGAGRVTTMLDESITTLAEVLADRSYDTAAFTGGGWMSSSFGLGQGFRLFDQEAEKNLNLSYMPIPLLLKTPFSPERPDFSNLVRKAVDWLRAEAKKKERFFLFIHTYNVHNYFFNPEKLAPYLERLGTRYDKGMSDIPKGPYRMGNNIIKWARDADEEELSYMKALYDAGIIYADSLLKVILDELVELDLDNETLIILTSDHGEGFDPGKHRLHHGGRLHNDQIMVPLIVKFPGDYGAGERVEQPVQLIDVFPTIMEYLGFQAPEDVQGRSLLSLIREGGTEDETPAYSEEIGFRFDEKNLRVPIEDDYRLVSVISRGEKFLYSPEREEMYDIRNDRDEEHDLLAEQPAAGNALRRNLNLFMEANKPRFFFLKDRRQGPGDDLKDTMKELMSLGYM